MNSLLQLVQGKGSSCFCLWIFLGIQSRCVISSHYELACNFSMMTKMKRLFHRSHKNISFLVCEQGYGIWDHVYQPRFDIDIQMVFHHCEPLCGSLMSVFSLKIVCSLSDIFRFFTFFQCYQRGWKLTIWSPNPTQLSKMLSIKSNKKYQFSDVLHI